jgi:hypothetical protein
MAKRSTNFTPRRSRTTGSDMLVLCRWLGMSDEEIRAMAKRSRPQPAEVPALPEPEEEEPSCQGCGGEASIEQVENGQHTWWCNECWHEAMDQL